MQAQPIARFGEGFDDTLERLVGNLALTVAGLVEVDRVDDAGQVGVGLDDAAYAGGQLLAERLGRFLGWPGERLTATHHRPPGFGGQVEAHQAGIGVDDGKGGVAVAVGLGQALDFVVEHIGEALDEQQRQEVVLELGRVLFAADLAGGVPKHLFHRFAAQHRAVFDTAAATARLGIVGQDRDGRVGIDIDAVLLRQCLDRFDL